VGIPPSPTRARRSAGASGRALVANALLGARFLPVWLATAALGIVAAFEAPSAFGNTSWSYILPYTTVLAVAALGQMLVVMHAGIDLSTPGVIAVGGNLIAGIGAGSDHRLWLAIPACLGMGALIGFANGVFVGLLRLNPLIVTLATGQIVLAWSSKYSRDSVTSNPYVPTALSSWATSKPLGVSAVFWTGLGLTIVVALLLRYSTVGRHFQAVGANSRAAWMAGLRVRTHVVLAYTAAGALYAIAACCWRGSRAASTPPSARSTAGADRCRRDRRSRALRRARERDVDLGRGARTHVSHSDAADRRLVGSNAIRRFRRGDPRRDGVLG
jgi:Ribose/xylose/arabinose/galactoside ABC-type transport systems, permease components